MCVLDRDNRLQQDAIGRLGVNIVYGAFHLRNTPSKLIASLLDQIGPDRIEVDMIEFNGQILIGSTAASSVPSLFEGLTHAVMFDEDGYVVNAAEKLYKQACN